MANLDYRGIFLRKSKLSLASIFFTFFIDNLCWSIVFPLFAPYFLDPENVLFSREVSEATRTTILSCFLTAFSLGQFLGAPILGEYADRSGRKKALAVSVFFTLVGLGITAWSMGARVLWLLFAGRLFTGLFSSNMSVCLAAVSDLSATEKARVKNFGFLSVFAGLSFILGAFLGGKLSDPEIAPFFSPNFPLWVAAALTFFNFLFICYGFTETSTIDPSTKFDFWESFRNIKQALQKEKIKRVYFVFFLFLFSWTILFQFTPVIVVHSFEFTSSDIGDLAIYMGICWAFGSAYLSKFLLSYFSSVRILEGCLCLFTIFIFSLLFSTSIYIVLPVVGFCVVIGGLAWPLCNNLISNMASKRIQGKILGISQSVQSLAMTLAPIAGGLATQGSVKLPFLIGALSGLIATFVYFTLRKGVSTK
ncbi:MAG TPA: MFS transporter [Chlamydiales bacterium]|nr:MFS transporter [Chlamydiales bacterium]